MEPTIETSPRNPSGTSKNQNYPGNNPWRSSYHHGGAVADPSGVTSYSSPSQSTSSPNQGPSSYGPSSYSQNLGKDIGINRNLNQSRQSHMSVEAYETALGWRVDILAGVAYLTPIMGFILLIIETKNDYVRIHAYQSLLLAIPIVLLHFLFISIRFLQTFLLVLDIGVYAWLGYQAYCSADNLERNLLPTIGLIAEQWTTEE